MIRDGEAEGIQELAPLLAALRADPKIVRYYEDLLKPLQRYDLQHFGDLTKTLATYLHHAKNSSRAADALYIHRNSLRYRLQRIKMLVGLDPDNPYEGLALQVAILLLTKYE